LHPFEENEEKANSDKNIGGVDSEVGIHRKRKWESVLI